MSAAAHRRGSLLGLVAAVAVVLAGCGGGGGERRDTAAGTTAAAGSTAPRPKEPLAAAAARLERELPTRDCKVLIKLMLHSIQRGTQDPARPPSRSDCDYIRTEAANQLRGFHLTKTREFGPAGFTEGTGDLARRGLVLGIVWLLDSDGSWKAGYEAVFRRQIDVAPHLAAQADQNALRLGAALKAADCAGIWRNLGVASRFVRANGGRRERFCAKLPKLYADARSAFAQIKADPAPKLDPLGRTRDFSFYALRLRNGRYMDLVLSGPLRNVAPAEIKLHANPSAIELVTVRQPSG